MTASQRWTKSIAFELNSLFRSRSLFTTDPASMRCSLVFRVSTPGVNTGLSSIALSRVRARVGTADMLFKSVCSFGLDETGYPPSLKEGATAPSTLGTRECIVVFA
ncbi:unnamed protein product [Phytophthora fragariaefolia]|uniref:Unnamed protein product n=1 Tax=Phytophthora fragariaefolia TaxID=1490495 RepID=A0A9W6WRU8_9STRA|nr:unnamed protein product [Phytophthora fragariaefolia]